MMWDQTRANRKKMNNSRYLKNSPELEDHQKYFLATYGTDLEMDWAFDSKGSKDRVGKLLSQRPRVVFFKTA